MLFRAIEYIESQTGIVYFTKSNVIPEYYTDRREVSRWASDAVAILANSGVMRGTSGAELSPKNPATVQECILLVLRIYSMIQETQ